MTFRKVQYPPHKLAFFVFNPSIRMEKGMLVERTCDEPTCVALPHLKLCTGGKLGKLLPELSMEGRKALQEAETGKPASDMDAYTQLRSLDEWVNMSPRQLNYEITGKYE